MKISNFRNYDRKGTTCLTYKYDAIVDVTTGFLWWKKTVVRRVHRKYASAWFFVDTGKFTQGYDVEALERSYRVNNGHTEDD